MAWEAICHMYFPQSARTAGGVKYLVRRDAYRGPPAAPSSQKPDVVVVELATPQVGPDGLPRSRKRDILWVECKAPERDQPGAWKTVLNEATKRLNAAHPTRNVWLIVASGLKWMVFYWDPSTVRAQPLQVKSAQAGLYWPLDPRINIAPGLPGQRHIDPNGITIHTEAANSLDFWTPAPPVPGQAPRPMNLHSCLLFLEQVFQAVQTGVYLQPNPATMS